MHSFPKIRIALAWLLFWGIVDSCAVAQVESCDSACFAANPGEYLLGRTSPGEAGGPPNSLPQEYEFWEGQPLASYDSASSDFKDVRVGYDDGFVISSDVNSELKANDQPFSLKLNGWGQLRHTKIESQSSLSDQNLFQLKRARLIFSGSAFTNNFRYFAQLDGRSSSGDDLRLLDYYIDFDIGRAHLGWEKGTFGFRTGRWKMPFHLARYLSGREFEFSDRSVASTFFDVNRSLAWGIYGKRKVLSKPFAWELAIFNGLVTGGAETGSSGTLDDNFAYSGRMFWYPIGEWGRGQLADLDFHQELAMRIGAGLANSTINRVGTTEFSRVRVVDSGRRLVDLLPNAVDEYTVNIYAVDASAKYRGWSATFEYYFRLIDDFRGAPIPNLFDHGHWLQVGKFIIPGEWQALVRWSRVSGESGTLGVIDQHSEEFAAGVVRYFRDEHAKLTFDATYLDGAPISSAALDVRPGEIGWLLRTQFQFAF